MFVAPAIVTDCPVTNPCAPEVVIVAMLLVRTVLVILTKDPGPPGTLYVNVVPLETFTVKGPLAKFESVRP